MIGARKIRWLIPGLIAAGVIGAFLLYLSRRTRPAPPPLSAVKTLAGAATSNDAVRFEDPFGVAVSADGSVYVSDGGAGRIFRVTPEGVVQKVAENLDVPSAIALAPDGTLVLAETGSHTIISVDPLSGQSRTVAGVRGRSGYADGEGTTALFNAPVGVAVGPDGTIYVADTYNDRIRAIDTQSRVRTLAGGAGPGMADAGAGAGADARFDTPCGVAVAPSGALVVADTGNNRLRRVELNGAVSTIAGTGEPKLFDGPLFAASFDEPIGVTVDTDGTIYVAEAGGSALRACRFGIVPDVRTLAGGHGPGLIDGPLEESRLRAPSGVAVTSDRMVIVADTGNRLVRAIVGETRDRGATLERETALALLPTAAAMRADGSEPRWPYDPPERPREIAATFGEIRGELSAESHEAYFHNGLDIPGAYGETARAVRGERVLLPLAVEDTGTWRERIRFPRLGYIHLRVGRDSSDRVLDDKRFVLKRDGSGRVVGVRVRRGETFAAGEPLGTLNNQYHVHLIAGQTGGELNALAALELPGVRDTVAPTIEKDGVRLFDEHWRELRAARVDNDGGKAGDAPLEVAGEVRIVVRAYDQMDGNAARRRLGLYRLGYQVLNRDGSPAPAFDQPQTTISFETLPFNGANAAIAYAEGSRSGATGETIFAYIVTNRVRDRQAAEDYWHASALPAGDYILRVFVEDFFGNRTTRDVSVRVTSTARP
ncbi:MAG TPA: SMP-30/gluconolactonase/LRE family protein [Pyrinomonadaceae bacterium]|nr:SMP-30/gluconolactonase/LRE family protein [Pyrinomonadaceae bacterium]